MALAEMVIADPPAKKKTNLQQKEKDEKLRQQCLDIKEGIITVPQFLNTIGYLLKC